MVYCIIIVIGLIFFFLILFLICLIFEFLLNKKISNEQTLILKTKGILHYTSEKGKVGINDDQRINGSKFMKLHFNYLFKYVFFYMNLYENGDIHFLRRPPKSKWKVIITNLSDKQLSNFKYCKFEKAFMYKGDFKFENSNEVRYIELTKNGENKPRGHERLLKRR